MKLPRDFRELLEEFAREGVEHVELRSTPTGHRRRCHRDLSRLVRRDRARSLGSRSRFRTGLRRRRCTRRSRTRARTGFGCTASRCAGAARGSRRPASSTATRGSAWRWGCSSSCTPLARTGSRALRASTTCPERRRRRSRDRCRPGTFGRWKGGPSRSTRSQRSRCRTGWRCRRTRTRARCAGRLPPPTGDWTGTAQSRRRSHLRCSSYSSRRSCSRNCLQSCSPSSLRSCCRSSLPSCCPSLRRPPSSPGTSRRRTPTLRMPTLRRPRCRACFSNA